MIVIVQFSIVVPIYKVEKFLPQCIESLIQQTYQDIEIILVNDGSPDRCGEICEEYARQDNRITVIHKENGGVVSARKLGTEKATGLYMTCIDGDDWIEPDYFEKAAELLKRRNVDIICNGFYLDYPDGTMAAVPLPYPGYYDRRRIEKRIYRNLIESEKCECFAPSVCTKIFRRELYTQQQMCEDDRMKIAEDQAVTKPCIYRAENMYLMPGCLYHYRYNIKSVTREGKPFPWSGPKLMGEHFEKQIPMDESDFQEQLYRRVTHEIFLVASSRFRGEKSYRQTVKEIKEHLQEPYYQKAMKCARFRGSWKGVFAHFALRHRLYFLLWLYSKYIDMCKKL